MFTHCEQDEELLQTVQLERTDEQETQLPSDSTREELTQAEHCCPLQALHVGCSYIHVKQPPEVRVRLLLMQVVHMVGPEQFWQLGRRFMQGMHIPLYGV